MPQSDKGYRLSLLEGVLHPSDHDDPADQYPPSFLAYEQDVMAWVEAADDDTRPYVAALKFDQLPDIVVHSLSDKTRDRLIEILGDAHDNQYAAASLKRLQRSMLGRGEFADILTPDLDRDFFARVNGTEAQERAETAARFVNELPEWHAMGLMPDTQLRMLTAFQQARRITPDIRRARLTIHDNIDQGDIYEIRSTFREQLADRLVEDPVVRAGIARWPDLADKERLTVLQHVVDVQNQLAGNPTVTVEIEESPLRETSTGKRRSRGHYQPDGPVRINRSDKAFWNNPAKVIGTAVHEVTHHDQLLLGRAYARGEIARDDPRYLAAAIFNDGVTHGYVNARTDTGHYQNQLVERLARATQQVVEERINTFGIDAKLGMTGERTKAVEPITGVAPAGAPYSAPPLRGQRL